MKKKEFVRRKKLIKVLFSDMLLVGISSFLVYASYYTLVNSTVEVMGITLFLTATMVACFALIIWIDRIFWLIKDIITNILKLEGYNITLTRVKE